MSAESGEEKEHLPHHAQLPLCTTRLPYRQGRKLTAVKVYTVNNESNHLLVFGVPALDLRQETKSLFIKFGKLLHFTVSTTHKAEDFTETYHIHYERIQSARIAKKMLDMKNFYGGSLHICYAPELESIQETRSKLLQRKRDVTFRLKNLQKEITETEKINQNDALTTGNTNLDIDFSSNTNLSNETLIVNELDCATSRGVSEKLNMGEKNIIYLEKPKRKSSKGIVIEKRFKPCFKERDSNTQRTDLKETDLEVVDCTSAAKEVVSNINEALNYDKFGNEIIKKVELKPLNRIVFKCNKKS